ncbi:MAG: ABC transporter substrate-binding protein [Hyphomicrobiales bacterium]|nr:ABC transporter substrate-binding protein [Hyphomicrobiales bacterium]
MQALRHRLVFIAALTIAALTSWPHVDAQETATLRLGQATTSVSFLPIWAARALDTFKPQGIDLKWAAIPGGDPTVLAALDAGDIDLAAVGTDTPLAAIAKGQDFVLVYTLMSQMSLELVVSNAFLARQGVSPSDPLNKRLAALKGALIGVSAVRGTQDRVARWLVAQAGLDPANDIKIALIGAPPAIHAALDHQQIDGFVLSPPEGYLAEEAGTGKIFVRIGTELPGLAKLPFLALVAKKPLTGARFDLAVKAARALDAASDAILRDPAQVAAAIQRQFFAKQSQQALLTAVETMKGGVSGKGVFNPEEIDALLRFTSQTDPGVAEKLNEHSADGDFWTDAVAAAAMAK